MQNLKSLLRCGHTHKSGTDAIIKIGFSKVLGKQFVNAFIPSEPVIKKGRLCADTLDNVFAKWGELKNGNLAHNTTISAVTDTNSMKGCDKICIEVVNSCGNKHMLDIPITVVKEFAHNV